MLDKDAMPIIDQRRAIGNGKQVKVAIQIQVQRK